MLNAEVPRAQPGLLEAAPSNGPAHNWEVVKSLLPRLRRHALVLTGDEGQADRSLAECLAALRRRPGAVRVPTLRLDLFRLYHATVRDTLPPTLSGSTDLPNRCLGGFAREARQVLSLVAVERFSVAEAAEVLGLSHHRVAGLLVQARRQLAAA